MGNLLGFDPIFLTTLLLLSPFIPAWPHAHSPAVSGWGVVTRSLAKLKTCPAGCAALSPWRPRCPASISNATEAEKSLSDPNFTTVQKPQMPDIQDDFFPLLNGKRKASASLLSNERFQTSWSRKLNTKAAHYDWKTSFNLLKWFVSG